MAREESAAVDQFADHLLPSLLSLVYDPMPDVKVLQAKVLWQIVLEKGVWALPASLLTLAVAGGS